ncbi:MAG: site-specific DNA-methyltransferase [Chloroflexi bacterium]|nr:site-specific DNA-methyltransferase [Chloroflexota bacterium]
MNTYKTEVYLGDSRGVLKKFPKGHFNLIVTSPPYADARKSHYDSIKPDNYAEFMRSFHDELWRVLADKGSFVLNIKDKVVNGVRHRYIWHTIEALSRLGWRCVDDYLWIKPNAMPGYWKNRLRDEWEYCFHLTKQSNFAMYQDAVRKPIGNWTEKRLAKLTGKSTSRHNSENNSGFGRDLRYWLNKNNVLPGNTVSVPLVGKNMGHPAAFPVGLPEFFIKLFTQQGDNVLDPFAGSGTTGVAAEELLRNVVLIDAKKEYFDTMIARLNKTSPSSRERVYFDCKESPEYPSVTNRYTVPVQPILLETPLNYSVQGSSSPE